MAESALVNSEESIMATFDFLASENIEDEENLSDGEADDGGDDDNDDKFLVKRAKVKVGSERVCLCVCVRKGVFLG